ncbi:MAG: hypothetical protein WCO44_00185 [Bacteroidota bacterium]
MINPQDFIHPEDEAARRNMEAIPGFTTGVRPFLKKGGQIFIEARVGVFGQQTIQKIISMLLFWPVTVTQIWGIHTTIKSR